MVHSGHFGSMGNAARARRAGTRTFAVGLAVLLVGLLLSLPAQTAGVEVTRLDFPTAPPSDVGEFQISPDGSTVVFGQRAEADDAMALYSEPVDGSAGPIQIGGAVESFALSADGQWVVWRSVPDTDGDRSLYRVRADGSEVAVPLGARVGAFALTPDGQRAAYIDNVQREFVSDEQGGHWEVTSMDLVSRPIDVSAQAVTIISLPGTYELDELTVSPDSQWVLYRFGDVYTVPLNGGAAPVALPGPGQTTDFQVSPDSQRVVYGKSSGSETPLYSAPIDGSAAPATLAARGWKPQISPDGSRVVFSDNTTVPVKLYGAPIDGSAAPGILSGAGQHVDGTSIAISPNGQRVVYRAQSTEGGLGGPWELYSGPIDGSATPMKISSSLATGRIVTVFAVSPDGGRVVYVTDADTARVFELYSVPLDGSAPPVKLNGPLAEGGNVETPDTGIPFAINGDGTWVSFSADLESDGVFNLYSVTIGGGVIFTRSGLGTQTGGPGVWVSERLLYHDPATATGGGGLYASRLLPGLTVTPDEPFESAGWVRGPFAPESTNYTLTNFGPASVDFSVEAGSDLVRFRLSPEQELAAAASGTLDAFSAVEIGVYLNPTVVNALLHGTYEDEVVFTDVQEGQPVAARSVVLTVQGLVVPSVTGLTQAAAETAIANAEIFVGIVTQAYSDTVPEGLVSSQAPLAGTVVANGGRVDFTVSKGPAPILVPDVVGLAQSDAESAITGARLMVGSVSQEYHETALAGQVIGQDPIAGTPVAAATPIALVVSLGPTPAPVPDVVGMQRVDAEPALAAARFVANVTEEYHATASVGQVLGQNPAAGTLAVPGTVVNLIVSKGPEPVLVPDLAGLTLNAAESALTAAGLDLGTVSEAYSAIVPSGQVISQDPEAGASVAPGTAVSVTISKGPQPLPVPDVVGMQRSEAEAALTTAGLAVGEVTEVYDATIPAGQVMGQTPTPETPVIPGTAVALVVSKGPRPVTVPNMVGAQRTAAEAAIILTTLTVGAVTEVYTDTIPAGQVMSQNPAAGSSVLPGTLVALTVSKGPQPVAVPDVVGDQRTDAETAIASAGLAPGAITELYSDTIPAGQVITQIPVAGTLVGPGASVALTVSKGPQPVAVPDVVGANRTIAETTIIVAGLRVGAETEIYDAAIPAGQVISQDPGAGTFAAPGTLVALIVSKGVQPVTVPNVLGTQRTDAEAAIAAASLAVGSVTEIYDATIPAGQVIRQYPVAGTFVVPGAPVALTVSKGVQPVTVPSVVGAQRTDAEAAIAAASLAVGTVTEAYDATIPAGQVIRQDPVAGALVAPGSVVALTVSRGVQPVTVPNVVGMEQPVAATVIIVTGLTVGAVAEASSDTVPTGEVISQSPAAGGSVSPGSPVDLVISLGPKADNKDAGCYGGSSSGLPPRLTGDMLMLGVLFIILPGVGRRLQPLASRTVR